MAGRDRSILQEGAGEALADHREIRGCDVLSGGFPCQPHSVAGRRLGRSDERWLWPAFKAAIGHFRPQFVVVENVPGLLTTEFGDVMGGLAELGFDAEWATLRASAFGAPHRRERLFIVAYPECERFSGREPKPRIFVPTEKAFTQSGYDPFRSGRRLEAVIARLRSSNGLSPRMVGRGLKGYGNAVVPQIAEWIGRRIVAAVEAER